MRYRESDLAKLVEINRWAFKEKGEGETPALDVRAIPTSIPLILHDFQVSDIWSWQTSEDLEDASAAVERRFLSEPFIKSKGTLEKDHIAVFEFPKGTVNHTSELYEVQIRPLDPKNIGGEQNFGTSEGIPYLGYGSSPDIPEDGLMKGEVGRLRAWPKDDTYFPDMPEYSVCADLFVSDDVFYELRSILASPFRGRCIVRADMVAQVFQHEVDAALSEPWHPQTYGLRIFGRGSAAYAPARLSVLRIDRSVASDSNQESLLDDSRGELDLEEGGSNFTEVALPSMKKNIEIKTLKQIRNIGFFVSALLAMILFAVL